MLRLVRIEATASVFPRRKVTASEIDLRLGLPEGTCAARGGVTQRFFAETETASSLGADATRMALDRARLIPKDIDAIVCACGTPQQIIPCNAVLLQKELGPEWHSIPCFDINSTCLSFVTALDVVSALVHSGVYKRVLIVSAEVASPGLGWVEQESCSLIGDGAAAVIVARDESGDSAVLGSYMETYSVGAEDCTFKGGGSVLPPSRMTTENRHEFSFQMDGPMLFKRSLQLVVPFWEKLMAKCDVPQADIDLFIPHQASLHGLQLMRRRLQIPEDRWMVTIQETGNTVAASIPIALDWAISQGRVVRGQKVMLMGTAAGLAMGGVLFRY